MVSFGKKQYVHCFQASEEREYINKGMVKHLGYIVRKTGAKIVLSSSWRGLVSNFVRGYEDNKPGIKLLFKYFRQENLVISSLTPGTCRMMGGYTRPLEIRSWLAKYHDIDSFVILDCKLSSSEISYSFFDRSVFYFEQII